MAGAEARIEAKAGSAEACRCSSGEVHCHFISPAPLQAPSIVHAVPLSSPISLFDQKRMRLTKSTKDRKKGCTYDPGVLNKQGALKIQTLWYTYIL